MIKQVTNVSSTASTILTPCPYTKFISITNNGSGNVRLSIDGGSTYTDPIDQTSGFDPTASTGFRLVAGAELRIQTAPVGPGGIDTGIHKPIRAVLESGTTTVLDIITDDNIST